MIHPLADNEHAQMCQIDKSAMVLVENPPKSLEISGSLHPVHSCANLHIVGHLGLCCKPTASLSAPPPPPTF